MASKRKSPGTPGPTIPGTVESVGAPVAVPGEGDIEVEVKMDDTPAPKQSLKDRLVGKFQAGQQPAPKTPARRRGKAQDNLIVTVFPTVLATLIVAYSRDRIPEVYQPCAPTMEEVSGTIGPLMAIIGRRIEIYGRAGQDMMDFTAALLCAIAYGTRAYITYVDIKKNSAATNGQPGSHAQAEAHRPGGYPDSGIASRAYAPPAASYAGGNGTNLEAGDMELRSYEAGVVAQMFARDRSGREGLGLLPRSL